MVYEIENFYGVYLLYNLNPKSKGKTYVGFTVDPNRRVKQHNRGSKAGGAKKTSGRGPWEMVLIVHGFPSRISALRFEWAWQNPSLSRRLKSLPAKTKSEKAYDYHVRLMYSMLTLTPWCLLPLTVQWLKQDYFRNHPTDNFPPTHMPICYGPVKSKSKKSKPRSAKTGHSESDVEVETLHVGKSCDVCSKVFQKGDVWVSCPLPNCNMISHMLCLARQFLTGSDKLLPVQGTCVRRRHEILWGQIVRKKMGCDDSATATGVSDAETRFDSPVEYIDESSGDSDDDDD